MWVAVTLAIVSLALFSLWRASPSLRPWPAPFAVIALAFPPVPFLVLAGQLSAVALGLLVLFGMALARGSRVCAGIALGMLAYKPSLLVPALTLCVLVGEWRICAVAAATAVLQIVAPVPLAGCDVVRKAIANTINASRHPDDLVVRPYLMVSWRTFWTGLVPATWVGLLYALSGLGTVALAAYGWRRTATALDRVGIMSVAMVLAAPHLYLYDLTIVLPALVSSVNRLLIHGGRLLRASTYAAFLAPLLVPVSAWVGVQVITPLLFVWMLAMCGSPMAREPLPAASAAGPRAG